MDLRFAANLSMLFTEEAFLDRFAAAKKAAFNTIEFQFPYQESISEIKKRLEDLGLFLALFNIHPGDPALGEFGTLCNPFRRDYFHMSLANALEVANILHCGQINVLVGKKIEGLEYCAQFECAIENLLWAVPQAIDAHVILLIEALNPIDCPHYLAHNSALAMEIVKGVNRPEVRLQYDIYHAQMVEGHLINSIMNYFSYIGHIQIADVPGRHQPGTGEINFLNIFTVLQRLEYSGFIGIEYYPYPEGKTIESLEWLNRTNHYSVCY
jgi:hydroxypyruvate isomerase